MFPFRKPRARRQQVRDSRPDLAGLWQSIRAPQIAWAVGVAIAFWAMAVSITTLRDRIVRVRPDQYVAEDVQARVEFWSVNQERVAELRQQAADATPSVYRVVPTCFDRLERTLRSLPKDVTTLQPEQLPAALALDSGGITALKKIAADEADLAEYQKWVANYVELLKGARDKGSLAVLPPALREKDIAIADRKLAKLLGPAEIAVDLQRTFAHPAGGTPSDAQREDLLKLIAPLASQNFLAPLSSNIAAYTVNTIPITHAYDASATEMDREEAAKKANLGPARRHVTEKTVLVERHSTVTPQQWKLLQEEQAAFVSQLRNERPAARLLTLAGISAVLLVLTLSMSMYIAAFQPKIVKNKYRSIALAGLMWVTLVVAQLAAISTQPILTYGTAPTILVAMILAIAYEQRFALGIGALHGLLVTVALGQGIGFFLVIWVGVLAVAFLLDEVRKRSKLVEVGAGVAVAMMLMTAALGALELQPFDIIGRSCLQAGASGLGTGFVALGILPFIEKLFRITTSMTLLELGDASHPALRRLQLEAPGTYNHSLQVATLSEAAAESVGANSLLCRVGSYYHDIGKVHKADYFCENQLGGPNRHLNLTPNVSLLVIVGHVKDGVELGKEYHLPPVIQQIIQQHHGTTLVEFFYHKAQQHGVGGDEVPESQFRYPGPKPRSREVAIIMMADAVESASRAMSDPAAHRIETLVHDLIMKRLLDGQFDDCDLTFGELELIEKALVKTVLSIHHGRLPYPSEKPKAAGPQAAVKSA